MNYRRRPPLVYAALTVAWAAVLLFVLPSDRLFWLVEPSDVTKAQRPQGKIPATKLIEFEGIVHEFPTDFAGADIQRH